jgi:hypothetical protein
MAVHQHASLSQDMERLSRRSKPGAGGHPSEPEGRCRGGVPDRATFKTNQRAMVAVLRWFACTAFCVALPILPRHQDLNFSSRLTPPLSAHIIKTYLNFG